MWLARHTNSKSAHEVPHVERHKHAISHGEEGVQLWQSIQRAAVTVHVENKWTRLACSAVSVDKIVCHGLQCNGTLWLSQDGNDDLSSLVAYVGHPRRHVDTRTLQLLAHLLRGVDLQDRSESVSPCSHYQTSRTYTGWGGRLCTIDSRAVQLGLITSLKIPTVLHPPQHSENHPPTPRSFFTSRTRSGALLTMNTMTTITRANMAEGSHVPHVPRHPHEDAASDIAFDSMRCWCWCCRMAVHPSCRTWCW